MGCKSVIEEVDKYLIVESGDPRTLVHSYVGPQGPPGEGIKIYDTVAEAEADTNISTVEICFVKETNTFYKYIANINRTAEHYRYLETSNGGNTRWLGISGMWSAYVPVTNEDGTLTINSDGSIVYTLF